MSIEKTPLWQAALGFVAKGWPVIPIAENAKAPALITDWEHNALREAADVDRMWEQHPNANIAFCPDHIGVAIIDIDPGAIIAPRDFPETYEVETPRGGAHLYYRGQLPPTVGKLADHVDTRGQRSYALLPPSIVEGKPYRVRHSRTIVDLPDEIKGRLAPRAHATESNESRLDLPGNVATARTRILNRLRGGTVAVQGRGGDDLTFIVAVELVRDLGISPQRTLELLEELWNPHCVPPWSRAELMTKIKNATEHGQNAVGAYASAPPEETFANANLAASTSEGPTPVIVSSFKMLGTKEQNEIPEPTWLLKDVIPEGRIVLMTAQKGHFKTFLALDLSLAIAANVESFGAMPEHSGLVVYSAHESLEEIARLHRPAWFAVKGIDQAHEIGFYLTEGVHFGFDGEREQFEKSLADLELREGRKVRLVVIDTYSAAMASLDENNPTDITNVIAWARGFLKRHPGCALIIVAHKGKDADRGTRGSSALEYGIDTVLDIDRIDNGPQVRVTVRRHRGAAERKAPFHFEARPVAKSLVLHLLTSDERAALSERKDPYSFNQVAAVLRVMGAVSDTQAVMTKALAHSIEPQDRDESNERYEARVRDVELRLRKLARTSLQELAFGAGNKLAWCLPPAEQKAEQELAEMLKT
jgi:hypothetical protein